jgi:hypothetical protein
MRTRFPVLGVVLLAACLAVPAFAQEAAAPPELTREQMADFLRRAPVVKHTGLSKGTTKPKRLTLSDGTVTHDAVFQSIDQTIQKQRFVDGRIEMSFRDSYRYNIAAYRLAELLGLDDMLPVTVEREWGGSKGSLSWWIDWKWDEVMRRKQDLAPPPERVTAYSNQLHLSRVFTQLVYDVDRNQTNTLISEDWKLYMVDFSRAFRHSDKLQYPETIQRCSRDLFERLQALTRETVTRAVGEHVEPEAITGLLVRRDRILERIRGLVQQRGEATVLF